jgi:hypothetical protein
MGDLKVGLLGVLSVEFWGKDGQDGLCITTLAKIQLPPGKSLPVIRDKNYRWLPINRKVTELLLPKLEGHILKLIDRN